MLQVLFNLALLVAFLLLFRVAADLPSSRWEPLGAGSFPQLVLAVLMVLNLVMIAINLRAAGAELRRHGPNMGRIVWDSLQSSGLVIVTFVLFGLYMLSIRQLGFVAATFLFVLVLQLLLGRRTLRGVALALVIAGVTAFGVDYIFATYFRVFLPPGQLWI